MFQQMKKRIKNEKGLTLVELLAVIVILAIVAAIAIPAIGNIIDNSRIKAIKADAANIVSASQIYYADTGSSTPFTLSAAGEGATSTGTDYVDLAGTTANNITVNSEGAITGGTLTRSGKTLTFTAATTLEDLKIDSATVKSVEGKFSITDTE